MSGSFDNLLRLQSLDEGEYGNISAGLRPPRVSAFDWIKARLLPIRKLDRQKPAVLAQLQRAVKSVRRNRRGGCLVHLTISFDCKVWTKESTGTFRRASVRLVFPPSIG